MAIFNLRIPSPVLRIALDRLGSSGALNRWLVERLIELGDGTTAGQTLARIGGQARAAKLSPEQRSAIAAKASRARWSAADRPTDDPTDD